jgi:aspartate/methionine/tyrosine aminotransferase
MKPAKRLEGIGEYYFSEKLREIDHLNKEGKNIINLGIGSPDLPPHPDVIKVLQERAAAPNVHGYQSYKGSPVLRNAISDWYRKWFKVDLDPATVGLTLIGSKEGIMHICMTWLNKGDLALVPDPGYPTYSAAVKLAGAGCIYYSLVEKNNYRPDLREIKKQDLSRVKLLFLNYPHMPTGQLAGPVLFDELVSFAKKHKILIVHDNPYSFILNEQPTSILASAGAKDCAIELNSLSKSHNMAGWRVGMLCGKRKLIDQVLLFKSNMDSGMFLPVQLAAAKALGLDREWHEGLNLVYRARREKVFEMLDKLRCSYSERQAGLFVWASVPGSFGNGYKLSDKLLHKSGVFITPGGIFGRNGKKYVRVSLCSPKEKIEEAIQRI